MRPRPVATEQPEAAPGAEIPELLARFKADAKRADAQMVANTDSEYWICIGFQSREQKEEFLRLTGIGKLGDKYLDGMKVAGLLGVELATTIPPVHKFKIDRKLLKLVRG